MIDEAHARSIAQAYFDVKSQTHECHFVIREGETVEKEYGWIIPSIAQEYLDRDPRLMMGGGLMHLIGGYPRVVVERESGAWHPLNTHFGLEMDIADFEAWRFFNFTSRFYDLTIRLVRDLEKTLELLPCDKFLFGKPFPIETGEEIIRPSPYRDGELRELLNQVPVTFRHQEIRPYYRDFQEIDSTGCCDYELVPSKNQQTWLEIMMSQMRGEISPGQLQL